MRRIRLEKGLTQEKFAEQSGFTQQYMSDLERGRRNPTIVSLYEIALALGVDHSPLSPRMVKRAKKKNDASRRKRGGGRKAA